jgi:hypothetical protein
MEFVCLCAIGGCTKSNNEVLLTQFTLGFDGGTKRITARYLGTSDVSKSKRALTCTASASALVQKCREQNCGRVCE